MNKLAAIQHAIEEVNKEAWFGTALRAVGAAAKGFGSRGASLLRRAPKPPVGAPGAAQAANSAQKVGLRQRAMGVINHPVTMVSGVGLPMAFGSPGTNLSA